jgi:hypothetical protein
MARCSIPEPHFNELRFPIEKVYEQKFMQRRSIAEEKQGSQKPDLFFFIDDHPGHGFPEVTPAAGEHACTDGVARGKERQRVKEDIVREGADAVLPGGCHTVRHSVEQVTGVGAAGGWAPNERHQPGAEGCEDAVSNREGRLRLVLAPPGVGVGCLLQSCCRRG